jgi:hypothetical protein
MTPDLYPPDGRPPPAPVIVPNAVYDLTQARALLGLAEHTLGREARLGRLRVSKRAGKYMILGKWLLAWVEAGEVTRRRRKATASHGGS